MVNRVVYIYYQLYDSIYAIVFINVYYVIE